jgi:hypothetical protein
MRIDLAQRRRPGDAGVAEWAGHSVDGLLKIYAKYVEGQEAGARRRIAAALTEGLRE